MIRKINQRIKRKSEKQNVRLERDVRKKEY